MLRGTSVAIPSSWPDGLFGRRNDRATKSKQFNEPKRLPAAAEGEMEVKGSDRYYIQSGVRRAVASQQRLLTEIPAIIYRSGRTPVNSRLNLSQLYSPKAEIALDQRFIGIVPPIHTPIEVEPLGLPGQLPSVPVSQVRLVQQGRVRN